MQEVILGDTPEAIAKRAIQNEVYQTWKNQIQSKFHNEHHKGAKAAVTNSPNNPAMLTKKKKRCFNLKPVCRIRSIQIYSQCYYQTCVLPYVTTALATVGSIGRGAKLNLSNCIMVERFEAETDSIREEVFTMLEDIQEEISEAEGKRSPADYLEAIDQVPVLLQCFLQEIAEQTGWWFSVLAGGPLPAENGNIHTRSFHIGQTPQGRTFLDEYAAFSVNPKDPNSQRRTFEESISALYATKVHAQCALNQAQLDLLNETAPMDTPLATPSPACPPLIAPVTVSPIVPQVASSIAPVTSPTVLPSPSQPSHPSQGVPWVPPLTVALDSNSLNPGLTLFNGLADDLNFFLVSLQQGMPEDSPFPPLPPWPPMHDDSNAQEGMVKDSHLPLLPPLPPIDNDCNAQQPAPKDSHLPPLLPIHDDCNMTAV
ncbi:hypothetical protein EDD18DRAFT_1365152 [Armillaria luteobubalina]|uniref:Uncharacterized protein n=1 Tax=Armillaria luteobubalina TaxID=153913 RepID=A0AA39P6E6_9AGAR|nr:hypothetical protein EDD18DRAFT_1365152 [Armillaria luteobubalina]